MQLSTLYEYIKYQIKKKKGQKKKNALKKSLIYLFIMM